jgi:hypothetical protein
LGADPLAVFDLMSSGNLQDWQLVRSVTGAEANQGIVAPQPTNAVQHFFQLLPP